MASGNQAVLVITVDDLVVHIAVPIDRTAQTPAIDQADLLRGPVREALAELIRETPVQQ